MYNIPKHHKCKNCGECCGIVPISISEMNAIKKCLDDLEPSLIKSVLGQSKDLLACPFRDVENKSCLIYNARPMLCKLFGVAEGMACPNGNSHNIDGYKILLNDIDKNMGNMERAVEYAKRK